MSQKLRALICSAFTIIFLLVQLLTLKDYGTSWDETLHFSRGHVFLNYFLTGDKQYDQNNPRKSYYQLDYQAGDFFFNDSGHPPINGILAAASNKIFYQKLGWFSDIHAYHLFNIAVSTLLVFVTVFFALETLGLLGGIIAFLTLLTYPLFFAEAHFNVKDPAIAAFFAVTIWCFYQSLNNGSWKWLLSSVIFSGLALGTKFNVLFLPFIIIPYLLIRYWEHISTWKKLKLPPIFLAILLLSPVIVGVIFVGSWPHLWTNWPTNLINVFNFYKEVGTGTQYQPQQFYFLGFNTFAVQWMIFTTPPVVLGLFSVGLISVFVNRSLKNKVVFLWLLWFLIPILRVTVPGSSIYGGIRQVMEFLPALALITSLGGWQIAELSKKAATTFRLQKHVLYVFTTVTLISGFLWPVYVLIKLHPNQNVYLNSLIGGLKGARQREFPSWGNSYGNAYFQGMNWLNVNAEQNARVALIQGTETNAPSILLRPDIKLGNFYWSGLDREGEYLMDLTFNDTGKAFHYTWEYLDKFLEPVYELKVDETTILKIWKNDLKHTKAEYRVSETLYNEQVKTDFNVNDFLIFYPNEIYLSRIVIKYDKIEGCDKITDLLVETSKDGNVWLKEKDTVPFPQVRNRIKNNNRLTVYFAGRAAAVVRYKLNSGNSCLFNNPTVKSFHFKDFPKESVNEEKTS